MKKSVIFVLNLIIHQSFVAHANFSTKPFRMPKTCKNKSYCVDKGEYYPNDIVTAALRTFLKDRRVNVTSQAETRCYNLTENPSRLTECNATYHCNERIYYVKDKNNITHVVIQSDLQGFQFKQLYGISKCTQEGPITQSKHFGKQQLKDVNMSCTTIYSEYYFHVLSRNRYHSIEIIKADLPVFCQCRVERNV